MYAETVTEGATMTDAAVNLPDIPDLSGVGEDTSVAFADGWYQGTVLEKREFTDQNGSDRVFESQDIPSANGESRNIWLQVEIKRQSDNRTLNTSVRVNYRPEDLSPETIQAITAHKESGEKWGSLFRPFMVLNRLGKLQKIAGVPQLQRNGDGGLNIQPLYGKTFWAKLGPDDQKPEYKKILDFRATKPAKATVL